MVDGRRLDVFRGGHVVGALRGVASCGRCGGALDRTAGTCARCGARAISAAPGSALVGGRGLLSGVQIAAPGRRRLAAGIDLALPVVFLAGVAGLAGATRLDADGLVSGAVIAGLALLAYLGAQIGALSISGRSLGRALLGLRTVDDLTGEPPSPRLRRRGLHRRTITADLRRGRDPLSPGATPVAADALHPSVAGVALPSVTGPIELPDEVSPTVVLALDSGERVDLASSLLVGRLPTNVEGEEHPVFAWADLSRSVAKTHALLEWSGTVLWVTDLGTANGTSLVAPDGTRLPLSTGVRGAAAPGWTIELGRRSAAVQASGVLSPTESGAVDGR